MKRAAKKLRIKVSLRKKPIRAFTLMELLIVIAILGLLASLVWTSLDPLDKMQSASDAKIQSDLGIIGQAQEAYAMVHSGHYAINQNDLVTNGDLKRAFIPPSNYPDYSFVIPSGCTVSGDVNCTSIVVCGEQKSKKYLINTGTPHQGVIIYNSTLGKACQADNTISACIGSGGNLSSATQCYVPAGPTPTSGRYAAP